MASYLSSFFGTKESSQIADFKRQVAEVLASIEYDYRKEIDDYYDIGRAIDSLQSDLDSARTLQDVDELLVRAGQIRSQLLKIRESQALKPDIVSELEEVEELIQQNEDNLGTAVEKFRQFVTNAYEKIKEAVTPKELQTIRERIEKVREDVLRTRDEFVQAREDRERRALEEQERIRIALQIQAQQLADKKEEARKRIHRLDDSGDYLARLAGLEDIEAVESLIAEVENAIREEQLQKEAEEVVKQQVLEAEAERKEAGEYNEMTDDWKDVWTLWQGRRLWCINDNHEYTEETNLGQWRCWQHAGVWSEGRWTCCGRTYARDNGCVAADHRPFASRFTDHQTVHNVPLYIRKKLGPRRGIIRESIVRYDKAEFEKKAQVDFDVRTTFKPSMHFDEPKFATFYQPELFPVSANDYRMFWDPHRKIPVYGAPEKRFQHSDGRYIIARVVKRQVFTDSLGRKTVSARLNPTDPLEPISLDHLQLA